MARIDLKFPWPEVARTKSNHIKLVFHINLQPLGVKKHLYTCASKKSSSFGVLNPRHVCSRIHNPQPSRYPAIPILLSEDLQLQGFQLSGVFMIIRHQGRNKVTDMKMYEIESHGHGRKAK